MRFGSDNSKGSNWTQFMCYIRLQGIWGGTKTDILTQISNIILRLGTLFLFKGAVFTEQVTDEGW